MSFPSPMAKAPLVENNFNLLFKRSVCGMTRAIGEDLGIWAERCLVNNFELNDFDIPESAKSTISIAFSPHGRYFASTHGDHTVKIVLYPQGTISKILSGHRRTPWTVKFHPGFPKILASGGLAGVHINSEVNIWDAETGALLHSIYLTHHVLSLDFHPTEHILTIACGKHLLLWDYKRNTYAVLMAVFTQSLRCVVFHPDGRHIITGMELPRTSSSFDPGTMAVELVMWAFNVPEARRMREVDRAPLIGLQPHHRPIVPNSPAPEDEEEASLSTLHPHSYQGTCFPMSFPTLVAARTVLFNDGGLHISKCGRFMVVTLAARLDPGMPLRRPPSLPIALTGPAAAPLRPQRQRSIAVTLTAAPPVLPLRPLEEVFGLPVVSTPSREGAPARVPRLPPLPRFRMVTLDSYSSTICTPLRFMPPAQGFPPRPLPARLSGEETDPAASGALPRSTRRRVQESSDTADDLQAFRRQDGSFGFLSSSSSSSSSASSPTPDAGEEGDAFPPPDDAHVRVAMLSLVSGPGFGCVLKSYPLTDTVRGTNVTSVKLSPTTQHVLITLEPPARSDTVSPREPDPEIALILSVPTFTVENKVRNREDQVNIGMFHPCPGMGIVYGTRQGKVVSIRSRHGPADEEK